MPLERAKRDVPLLRRRLKRERVPDEQRKRVGRRSREQAVELFEIADEPFESRRLRHVLGAHGDARDLVVQISRSDDAALEVADVELLVRRVSILIR